MMLQELQTILHYFVVPTQFHHLNRFAVLFVKLAFEYFRVAVSEILVNVAIIRHYNLGIVFADLRPLLVIEGVT